MFQKPTDEGEPGSMERHRPVRQPERYLRGPFPAELVPEPAPALEKCCTPLRQTPARAFPFRQLLLPAPTQSGSQPFATAESQLLVFRRLLHTMGEIADSRNLDLGDREHLQTVWRCGQCCSSMLEFKAFHETCKRQLQGQESERRRTVQMGHLLTKLVVGGGKRQEAHRLHAFCLDQC